MIINYNTFNEDDAVILDGKIINIKNAINKQSEYSPNIYEIKDKNNNLVDSAYTCNSCDKIICYLEDKEFFMYKHCPNCGQKILWNN